MVGSPALSGGHLDASLYATHLYTALGLYITAVRARSHSSAARVGRNGPCGGLNLVPFKTYWQCTKGEMTLGKCITAVRARSYSRYLQIRSMDNIIPISCSSNTDSGGTKLHQENLSRRLKSYSNLKVSFIKRQCRCLNSYVNQIEALQLVEQLNATKGARMGKKGKGQDRAQSATQILYWYLGG